MAWIQKHAGTCSTSGAWGILGVSSGGRYQQCAHWKKWDDPEFVTGRVWRCAKWATSQAVAHPYAGVEELRSFARACDSRAEWTTYRMAVLSFTCLLRVGEAAPIRRGGSRGRGLGFHTVKCDPHFVQSKPGSYGKAWLRWLDREGSTSAVLLAHFCPKGAAYLQMVMATALSGCASAHAQWHVWRRGGSAAFRWLGLPVRWLACWGHWMSQLVAAHYGDAQDNFIDCLAHMLDSCFPLGSFGTCRLMLCIGSFAFMGSVFFFHICPLQCHFCRLRHFHPRLLRPAFPLASSLAMG